MSRVACHCERISLAPPARAGVRSNLPLDGVRQSIRVIRLDGDCFSQTRNDITQAVNEMQKYLDEEQG